MKMSRVFAVVAVLALLPTLPFAIFGYSGHDYRLHLTSWMELRQAWLRGDFAPGWAALANYGLGEPRFSFYPPFSFWIGTVLSLLLPFRLVPAAFVWLAFVLSGLSMYAASQLFVAQEDRLKAAALYMATPYLLLTAINRFAAAELLVQAWLPLLVLYFYRAVWHHERRAVILMGCLFGLSWLTNIPASIVLVYSFLAVALIAGVRQRSFLPMLYFVAAECISAALAAFHLVPVLLEQKWISPTAVLRYDFRNNFIFIPISHLPVRGFGLCCWLFACVEIALIAIFAYTMRRRQAWGPADLTLIELASVAFVFQLPITTIFWQYLPKFRYIGFPFRFLSVIGVALPLILLARSTRRSLRRPAYVLLGLMAILPFWGYPRPNFELNPRPYPSFAEAIEKLMQGYPGMPEFVPAGARRQNVPVAFAPVRVDSRSAGFKCSVILLSSEPRQRLFSTDSDHPCTIRVAVYFYPYWRVVDEAGESMATDKDPDGLLLVTVPEGKHQIRVGFKAASTVRRVSRIVTLVMALLVALTLIGGSPLNLPWQPVRAAVLDHGATS